MSWINRILLLREWEHWEERFSVSSSGHVPLLLYYGGLRGGISVCLVILMLGFLSIISVYLWIYDCDLRVYSNSWEDETQFFFFIFIIKYIKPYTNHQLQLKFFLSQPCSVFISCGLQFYQINVLHIQNFRLPVPDFICKSTCFHINELCFQKLP